MKTGGIIYLSAFGTLGKKRELEGFEQYGAIFTLALRELAM